MQLEQTCNEMRKTLHQDLQASQNQKATEIQKIFSDKRDGDFHGSQFEMTNTVGGPQGQQPSNSEFLRQQDVWE